MKEVIFFIFVCTLIITFADSNVDREKNKLVNNFLSLGIITSYEVSGKSFKPG